VTRMYVPPMYRPNDPAVAVDLIRDNPLATLVSPGPERPFATHLPAIFADPLPGHGDLIGARMLGHMNRQNPHWAALAPQASVVLIFQGPHGYVSPAIYGLPEAAPTWDFTAVHVHGLLRPIDGPEQTLRVIEATVRALEGRLGRGWDMKPSLAYFGRLLPGVGAFQVEVTDVDSMFKLSQEQPSEVRGRVSSAFAASGARPHRRLSTLIDKAGS
jgi:transcriptional regulator